MRPSPVVEPVTTTPSPALEVPVTYPRPAEWPAAALYPATFDPARASLLVGDHGDLRIEHHLEDAKLAAVVATWTEELTRGGFTPREPCTDAATYACVWIGHDRLVVIAAWPDSRTTGVHAAVQWLPVGHVATTRLPGKCVTPPIVTRTMQVSARGIDQDGESRSGSSVHEVTTRPGADIDGDAQLDVLVPHAKQGKCPWDVPHDVYVMRGECGHKVGTIVGQIDDETSMSAFRKGLRRIHTHASWADHGSKSAVPEHHTRSRVFTFDGVRLKKTSDATRTGQCHHCGVVSCSEN